MNIGPISYVVCDYHLFECLIEKYVLQYCVFFFVIIFLGNKKVSKTFTSASSIHQKYLLIGT